MSKKIISTVLALCMLISCVAVGSFVSNAVTVKDSSSVSASQDAQSTIQGSAVLHCFNWSYNTIKSNLPAIAAAGYTAVQTSPVQQPKDYSSSYTDQSGQWWKLYQPITIGIATSGWLGTSSELTSLCTEAHNYNIKVIVDIVANHMANKSGTGNNMDDIHSSVESTLRSNSSYWHINDYWANDDNNRYTMTQGSIGEPDLNTGNSYIQSRYKQLLIDCINCGVDGFRFDAAKHIELPSDSSSGCASQFWPTVINGSQSSTSKDIYYYGEILNGCGTSISNYTQYMSVTDNYAGDKALVSANNSDASGLADSSYYKGGNSASQTVLWAESHDTYMGSAGSGGLKNTSGVASSTVIKAWAIIGSRANATSLFFARPATTMGSASSDTSWKSTAVAEVNKFKNYFDGQSEYLSSSGSVAYNERGTSGVVISKLNGSGSVSLTAHKMASGTYTDQVSGNTFTVSGGKISGTVGSSGVAVVYNPEGDGPSASVTPGSTSYKTDTLTLTLNYDNATSGSYSIDGGSYTTFTIGQTITIGSGLDYGTATTVTVKATDGTTTSDPVTYTYTKVDPDATQKIYFDNSSYEWSQVYAYVYSGDTANADWPGVKMTYDSATGYYVYEVPEGLEEGRVLFTESYSATTNRYPADGVAGLPLEGTTKLFTSGFQFVDYTPTNPTTAAPTTAAPTTTAPVTTVKPTTAPVTTTAPSTTVLVGDANQDGTIDVNDVTAIQRHSAEILTLTGNAAVAGDVDRDGMIDVIDATLVQYHIAGVTKSGSYCGTYVEPDDPLPTTAPTTAPATTVAPTTAAPTTVAPTTASTYVYYKNTNGWSTVKAYYWSDSNTSLTTWPGVSMTSLGNNVWRVSVPSEATKIIFNNGNSGSGNQTDNINLDGYGKIYDSGTWSTYDENQQTTTVEESGDTYTIRFTNNAGWSGSIYCYYWGGSTSGAGFPGTKMTNVSGLVYEIEIPNTAKYMIFSTGSSAAQTENVNVTGSATYQTNGQLSNGWYAVTKVS